MWDVDEYVVLNSFFPDMHAFVSKKRGKVDGEGGEGRGKEGLELLIVH